MKKTADISIVTANYNNGKFLDAFFESILNSSVLPEELIFVDDGSTDNSLKVIEKYKTLPFLKVIAFKENRGFCHALNAGLEAASGKYILRIDPDDIMLKNRIKIQTNFLDEYTNIDVVGSNVVYFDSRSGKKLMVSNFPADHKQIEKEYLKGDHGVQHPTVMIRTEVMKKYRYDQKNVLAEDYEIFAKMIKDRHLFANIREPLVKMRIHGTSAGSNIKYETIKRTFELRHEIFGIPYNRFQVKSYYLFMLNYRKFLITDNRLKKPFYLGTAVLFNPQKLFNRILK